MRLGATQVLALVLAGFAAAAPSSSDAPARTPKRDRSAVIGYRTVNKLEADDILDFDGTFVDTGEFRDEGAQTGLGKYLSPKPGEHDVGSNNKYCIVWANRRDYEKAEKVWITEDMWWPRNEEAMKNHIRGHGVNPDLALRYSKVYGRPGLLQMMVPFLRFSQYDHPIGLEVECFDSIGALKEVEDVTVDYKRDDIKNKGK